MSNNVTALLRAAGEGESDAAFSLLNEVYAELKRMAAGRMGGEEQPLQTLQATALVHEAWLRLVDSDGRLKFENRSHFFGAASEAMRRVLVDHARRRLARKRGGGLERLGADNMEIAAPDESEELLLVHEALDKLSQTAPRKAELVKLRYFAGLSFEEAAALLQISVPTAHRDWAYARAWLRVEIGRETGGLPK